MLTEVLPRSCTWAACVSAVHQPRDPEYTILKQRLARRLRFEGTDDQTGAMAAAGLLETTC
jgi:hypothetical protein